MAQAPKKKTLYDAYCFPGFTPVRELIGRFGDRWARVIRLKRRSKKRFVEPAALLTGAGMTSGPARSATSPVATIASTWNWTSAASIAGSAAR